MSWRFMSAAALGTVLLAALSGVTAHAQSDRVSIPDAEYNIHPQAECHARPLQKSIKCFLEEHARTDAPLAVAAAIRCDGAGSATTVDGVEKAYRYELVLQSNIGVPAGVGIANVTVATAKYARALHLSGPHTIEPRATASLTLCPEATGSIILRFDDHAHNDVTQHLPLHLTVQLQSKFSGFDGFQGFSSPDEERADNQLPESNAASDALAPAPRSLQAQTITVARVAINSYITMEWVPPAVGATDITITVYFAGTGWVAVGVGTASMVGADVWFMKRSGAAVGGEVLDTKSNSYVMPSTDASQDVTLVSVTQVGSRTAYKVKRNLDTGDANDNAIGQGTVPMTFAWDLMSSTYGYHGNAYVSTSLNFFNPPANALVEITIGGNSTNDWSGGATAEYEDVEELQRAGLRVQYSWHGFSMFSVWAILVPAGSLGARFYKHVPAYQAGHKWVMIAAACITVPAAGGALLQSSQSVHLAHAQVGMTLAVSTLAQVIFGAIVRSWLTGEKVPPKRWRWFKYVHRGIGWILFGLGSTNCVLGADMLFKLGKFVMLGYQGMIFVVFLCLSFWECKTKRKASLEIDGPLEASQARGFAMARSKYSITLQELHENIRAGSQWVIVQGYVYDIAAFTKNHPGGAYLLHKSVGSDVTQMFFGRENADHDLKPYFHSMRAYELLQRMCVAALKSPDNIKSWADTPAVDERACSDDWKVVRRTIVCHDPLRPVIRLDLMHHSANAVPAVEWDPQSFGRHVVARATPEQMKQMAARGSGGPAGSGGASSEPMKGDSNPLFDPRSVERPYTIVRADNKPGLTLYIRRYPKGALSPYVTSLRPGDSVSLTGPTGLGMHIDPRYSGIIIGIYQGTCIAACFDLIQYIVARSKEMASAQTASAALTVRSSRVPSSKMTTTSRDGPLAVTMEGGSGVDTTRIASGRLTPAGEKPHLRLVLMVVAEHEEGIVEREWLQYIDSTCDDFELHINVKKIRNPANLRDASRVYTGRLNAERVGNLLPPADLLTVSVCGTPGFQNDVKDLFATMNLPKSLITTVS